MNDQPDALLRERLTRLLAAVPPEPVPEIRPRRMPSRGIFRRRILFAVGLGLLLLTALVVSLPTLSKPTYEAALRAVGVPEGAEVITWGSDKDGNLFDVVYRDATGKEHVLNPLMTPRATPTPRP
jgi:hypothetical protein